MERICRNCQHWEWEDEKVYGFQGDFKIGYCNGKTDDVAFMSVMESDQISIICSQDGPIYFGENFGCIHFKGK